MQTSTLLMLSGAAVAVLAIAIYLFLANNFKKRYEQNLKEAAPASKEKLQGEIDKELRHRRKYTGMDFALAHTFLWLSVIASFSSSIIIATGTTKIESWVVAFFAGIPGLVVVIDKSFDFKRRSVWGTMYTIELEKLRDELEYGNINLFMAAKKLRLIKKKNEMIFNRIGFFAQQKQDDGDQRSGRGQQGVNGQQNGQQGGQTFTQRTGATGTATS